MILDYTSSVSETTDELRSDSLPLLLGAIQTGFFAEVHESCRYCDASLEAPKSR